MQVAIIDDEQPAIELLQNFVEKVPFLNLVFATTDALSGMHLLSENKVDLLFLDIEMPDITGLELIQALEHKPLIILTTAYEQYALKGYELDVVDYLLKPIPFNRFLTGVNKAKSRHTSTNQSSKPEKADSLLDDCLFVKVDYKTVKIRFTDILYIEGLKDYVKIYTKENMIIAHHNLKQINEKLPEELFVRIHRSFIVSIPEIVSIQKSQLELKNKSLPIGKTYRETIQNLIP